MAISITAVLVITQFMQRRKERTVRRTAQPTLPLADEARTTSMDCNSLKTGVTSSTGSRIGIFSLVQPSFSSGYSRYDEVSSLVGDSQSAATKCPNRFRIQEAVVYVQESLRLSAHGAKSFHRILLLFLLVDQGVVSDFFLLSTQEGLFGRIQSISLGYNLAGVMSMIFEMVETMNWMSEKLRCQMKRLLFNYETVLVGEFITAGVLQQYLTSLSKSRLKDTQPAAEVVSYYLMGLVGHIVLALGCLTIIVSTRAVGAIAFVWWRFGTIWVLAQTCSVDAALGARSKLILLHGYIWENGELYYRPRSLKALGVLKAVEPDGSELFVHTTLHWGSIPHVNFVVLAPNSERPCSGSVSFFDRELGGNAVDTDSDIGNTLLPQTNSDRRGCCFKRQSERICCSPDATPGPRQTKIQVRVLQKNSQVSSAQEDTIDSPVQVFRAPQHLVDKTIELKSPPL